MPGSPWPAGAREAGGSAGRDSPDGKAFRGRGHRRPLASPAVQRRCPRTEAISLDRRRRQANRRH